MWFLTRYEDCKTLLSDKRLGHLGVAGNSMLFQNPPDHTRLRGLVNRAFTPRMVEQYRDRVQAITHRLLDEVQADGHMDLMAKFAYLLPVTVIAEMLGCRLTITSCFSSGPSSWSRHLIWQIRRSHRNRSKRRLSRLIPILAASLPSVVQPLKTTY